MSVVLCTSLIWQLPCFCHKSGYHEPWTTDDQKEWLEQRKAAFIEAKQKGSPALQEFYTVAFVEFREKWPMDPVTSDKVTAAGSAELATKIKRDKYDKVCWPFML